MDTSDREDTSRPESAAAAVHDLGRACQDFFDLELSGNNKPVGPPIQAWHDLSHAAMRAGAPSGIVKRIAFPRTLHPVPIERVERGAPAAYDVSNWTAGFILYGQESTRVELLAAVSDLVAWCNDRLAAGLQAKPSPPAPAEQRTGPATEVTPPAPPDVGEQPATPVGKGTAPVARQGKATINARMIDVLQREPDAMGWTAKQWAKRLKCSPPGIVGTNVWKSMKLDREKGKAEQASKRAGEKRKL